MSGTRLLALSLACALSAQNHPVRGVVIDEAGQPLAGVALVAFPMSEPFITAELLRTPTTHTAADGTFALNVDTTTPPWPANVLFAAPGRVHVVAGIAYADLTPVVLPKAKRLAGRVRDAAGKPLAGVRIEARDYLSRCVFLGRGPSPMSVSPEPRTAVRSDAEGRFVLDGVCDTAIWLLAGGQGFTRIEHGPLAAGDSFDVEVAPAPITRVTVVDRDGKPVVGVSVAVTTSALPHLLGRQEGTTDAQGRFGFTFLAAPSGVYVQDRDYRRLANETLTAPQAELRLVAAAPPPPPVAEGEPRVFGRVVDPETGRGVAGAKVDVVPVQEHREDGFVLDNMVMSANRPGVRANPDGRFAVPAEDGERWLVASDGSVAYVQPNLGRAPTPRTITLTPGAVLNDVELTLQPTFTVPGKLRGALSRGSNVRFLVQRESRWSSEAMEFRPRFPLDAQRSFVAKGVLARGYDVQVLLPRLFRQGLPDKLTIGATTIDGKPIELDASPAVPASVRGKVATPVPPQRVAVVLLPTAFDNKLTGAGYALYDGPVCPLDRDGSFVLRGGSGPRTLVLLDLATGVVFAHKALGALAPGEERTLTIEPKPQPAPVRVQFAGLPASDTLWLDVRVADAQWLKVGQIASRSDDGSGGVGTRVPRGTNELTLWLPPGETTLVLRAQEGIRSDGKDILASDRCDPAQLRDGRIELKVE